MDYHSLDEVKQRIDQNYNCIKELEKLVPLQKTDEEKAGLLSLIGKMYAEYVTGKYASNELEREIIEIGSKISFQPSREPKYRQILIVMSEAGAVGGHTVLAHNWVKWDKENKYSIIFTDMAEASEPGFIKEAIAESGGNIFYLQGSVIAKAGKLLDLSQEYERIILFTHMNDIVPVLAYSNRQWSTPVYFYNHADFRFSYGFSIADVVFNLCEFDLDKTARYRGVCGENNIYFPFPGNGRFEKRRTLLEKKKIRKRVSEKYRIKEDEKLIVSMGSDFKYENIIGYEFDTFVSELLKRSEAECSFLIIGADKNKEKWIKLEEKTSGKARALGTLPREEAEEIISAADLYIVSFPMWAAGMEVAEHLGVPNLCLNIIGRNVNETAHGVANTIPELIEKSLDALCGNGNRYLGTVTPEGWSRQRWILRLQEIYKKFDSHTVYSFWPIRRIDEQEYVNCQLLQKQAGFLLLQYIISHGINQKVQKELYQLDRTYDMGIIYAYAEWQKKKYEEENRLSYQRLQLANKHLQLYKTSLKWVEVKRKGKMIDRYLYCQGYRKIAIYGMGYMGRSLVDELKEGLVEVMYGIDRNADQICAEIPIFMPSDKLKKVDLILNTTTIENLEIMDAIKIAEIEIIQFSEMLDELNGKANQ